VRPAAPAFLFSRLPLFTFISCAHQTTFRKKKKTHGKVFGGNPSPKTTSSLKISNLGPKTRELTTQKRRGKRRKKCKKINVHGHVRDSKRKFCGS